MYAIYQALLTALRTEALRKRGAIERTVQIRMITSTVWESVKQGAAVSLVLSLVGMGKASLDLFHAFWDGLDELQRAELLAAAMEAGVNLRRWIDGNGPGLQGA